MDRSRRKRLLVVQDAKTKGHRLLDEAEFDIVRASGRPIRLLKERPFDLVVTDISAATAFKLVDLIREQGIDTPVVVVVPDERKSRLPKRLSQRATFVCDASTLLETVRRGARRSKAAEVQRLVGFRNQRGEEIDLQHFSATVVKNTFGRILGTALRQGGVAITHHESPTAVLLSVEEYNALVRRSQPQLDALTAEFDSLLAKMQAPGMRDRVASAFDASPAELGEAAVVAARRDRG